MILMGDEVRRTQDGNNNTYCQDNEIELVRLGERRAARRPPRFTRGLIHFRRSHPNLHRTNYFRGRVNARGLGR